MSNSNSNSNIELFVTSLLNKQIIVRNFDCDDNLIHYIFANNYVGLMYNSICIDDMWVNESNELVFWNCMCDEEYTIKVDKILNGSSTEFRVIKNEVVSDLF